MSCDIFQLRTADRNSRNVTLYLTILLTKEFVAGTASGKTTSNILLNMNLYSKCEPRKNLNSFSLSIPVRTMGPDALGKFCLFCEKICHHLP